MNDNKTELTKLHNDLLWEFASIRHPQITDEEWNDIFSGDINRSIPVLTRIVNMHKEIKTVTCVDKDGNKSTIPVPEIPNEVTFNRSTYVVGNEMDDKACKIVADYVVSHLDKSDPVPVFTVYTVWKCKILQHWKYLISTSLPDKMYYEVTFNGDKQEWYLDAYVKLHNETIKF